MISMRELLGIYKRDDIDYVSYKNMETLLTRMNRVRAAYGKPMTVTNCYRSKAHHLNIYARKGITDQSKIPMASKHLSGQAVDISDPSGDLHKWCQENEDLLRSIGLWLEKRQGNWQHFQMVKFNSYKEGGTIWFQP